MEIIGKKFMTLYRHVLQIRSDLMLRNIKIKLSWNTIRKSLSKWIRRIWWSFKSTSRKRELKSTLVGSNNNMPAHLLQEFSQAILLQIKAPMNFQMILAYQKIWQDVSDVQVLFQLSLVKELERSLMQIYANKKANWQRS